tara:strand:+ start:2061 stop:2471 length:411 start_codon:yes stop_codon:yes gene_type:complete
MSKYIDPANRNKASASSTVAGVAAELLKSSICEDNGVLCRWDGATATPITAEENTQVLEKHAVVIAEETQRLLREERDLRLSETDWMVTKATETGSDISPDWKSYRQALRDLPAVSEPSLNENRQLSNVTWPEKPE